MNKREPLQSLLCDPVRKHRFVAQLNCEQVNNLISVNHLDGYSGGIRQEVYTRRLKPGEYYVEIE